MSRSIKIANLTMSYGDVLALDNVSLEVQQGEMLAILGPSGCGKSTMLSLISGLRKPTKGEIYLDDMRIDKLPTQQREVGFLFQNYALFPHLTVRDNIGFGLKIKKKSKLEIKKRVDELLEIIGLTEHAHKKPNQLSGGQQQRVALARALAPKPGIILLDEPLSALDVKIRQKLRIELKSIQRELGITTILVTHDQEEAFQLGDRVAVMNAGKIEQIGSPPEIYDNPATEFVACFVGEINILSGVVYGKEAYACSLAIQLPDTLQNLPEKTPVRILVRPENFKLVKEVPDMIAKGAARGTYRSTTFLGSHLKLEILLDNGQVIYVTIPKDKLQEIGLMVGDRVV
ncbi:MAG: ABC transporter ATP-binding protein, partial [Bacillota bacterium]|nr:ABC transporter ATP-binding protein [Bacillota bacterium]